MKRIRQGVRGVETDDSRVDVLRAVDVRKLIQSDLIIVNSATLHTQDAKRSFVTDRTCIN